MEQRMTGLEPTFRAWKAGLEAWSQRSSFKGIQRARPKSQPFKASARVFTHKSEPGSPGFIKMHIGFLIQQ